MNRQPVTTTRKVSGAFRGKKFTHWVIVYWEEASPTETLRRIRKVFPSLQFDQDEADLRIFRFYTQKEAQKFVTAARVLTDNGVLTFTGEERC